MTFALWWSVASAAAPPAALSWALPFRLSEPEPAAMIAGRPAYTEGWLLQVRIAPELATPRQGLTPLLWIGDQPVRPLTSDPVGGCVVVLLEGPVDLRAAPVFVGPAELAERVRPEEASARAEERRRSGVSGFTAAELTAALVSPVTLGHAGELDELVEGRAEVGCAR